VRGGLIALNREAIRGFVTSDVSGLVRIGSPSDYGEAVLPSGLQDGLPNLILQWSSMW